jgi:hypothetical protein
MIDSQLGHYDLYDPGNTKLLKRYWDFWMAQLACEILDSEGKGYRLYMYDGKSNVIGRIERFRIPRLQTTPN